MSNITSGIGGLGIDADATAASKATPAAAPPATSAAVTEPAEIRLVRETGEPLDEIEFCTDSRIITYPLVWYYLADLPGDAGGASFTCSRCYADYIADTPLADQWTAAALPEGVSVLCCFYIPRIKLVLWPQAVASNRMLELRAFFQKWMDMAVCPRDEAVKGVKGGVWYGMWANEIPGFVSCERCYERFVAGTAFEDRFAPYGEPAEEHEWSCHMSGEKIGRIVTHMSAQNDWKGFLAAAGERRMLPACPKEPVASDSRGWYLARGELRNIPICATCYRDALAATPFADRFRRYRPQFDRFPSPGMWSCGLATLPPLLALESALQRHDWEPFESALKAIAEAVPCTENGIVDGTWWTLKGGGCPDFAVCYQCFVGVFWIRALDGFLMPATPPKGEAIMCALHPTQPRFAERFKRLGEAVDKGVFEYFAGYVRKYTGVKVCGKNGGWGRSKWYGYHDSYFCEDCYLDYVKDTVMGDHLQLNGEVLEEVTVCQIWSPRMRHYWEQVCDAGEPGSAESKKAVEDFLGVSRYRKKVYSETLGEIELLKQMKKIQRTQAMHNGLMSIRYQGIAGIATAMGQNTGQYQYGNSSLGWYDTSAGFESRVLFGKFTEGLANSQLQPSEVQKILALQKIWSEVE